MDEWLRKMYMIDGFVRDALKYARIEDDSPENQNRFLQVCARVLEKKDPLVACCFAADISHLLKGAYAKLFNVQKFQDVVMQSDDDEVLYKFARDVKGADIKRVIDRLPNGYARKELKHDMKPIDEEVF